jgi:acetyl esterase/lipase
MTKSLTVLIASMPLGALARCDEPRSPVAVTIVNDIAYREGSSKSWRLDLAHPKDVAGKPRPGVVVIHGGGWVEGDKSSFASKKHGVPGNIEELAEAGFVAAAINYRLSGEAPFPAALEDCKCALRWLRAHAKDYDLDPDHIGAYGNSAGGHLALLVGLTDKDTELKGAGPYRDQSSAVQAVVSDSGPVDLVYQVEQSRLKEVVSKFLGGLPEGDRVALYKKASPEYQIGKRSPPVLLIYGAADDQVPVESADRFVAALDKAGVKDVTYHRLAYVDHCPHSLVRIPWLKPVVAEFFDWTLMHPETATKIRRRER